MILNHRTTKRLGLATIRASKRACALTAVGCGFEPLEPRYSLSGSPVLAFPDVPDYGSEKDWILNAIHAPEVWAQGHTGKGVVVAVIDSGIDLKHVDLDENLWTNDDEIPDNGIDDDQNGFVDDFHGWDFAQRDNMPNDTDGHGSHVAGVIAAERNTLGATGVAYDAKIMPIQALSEEGSAAIFDMARAIEYAVDNGARIVNLSLTGSALPRLQRAISYAADNDVLIVAASGNRNEETPDWPARYSEVFDNVISVGAHGVDNQRAPFSNLVGDSGAVQVDAPGIWVYSTILEDRYASYNGTSMATPQVSGLAALTLSANPALSARQLRKIIVDGADRPIQESDSLGGINAASTVAIASTVVSSIGDIDKDGTVGFSDFVILSTNFNLEDARPGQGDLDGDGVVGFSDFVIFSTEFGAIRPAPQTPILPNVMSDAVDQLFADRNELSPAPRDVDHDLSSIGRRSILAARIKSFSLKPPMA